MARRRSSDAHDDEADFLTRVAEDYYIAGRTQEEIARRFDISRSYVSRLLARARSTGLVEISINRPVGSEPELEADLRRYFGLKDAVVVADGPGDPLQRAGQGAANYLMQTLTPDHVIAVSWGTGVKAVSEALRPGRARARHIVQMFGGLGFATYDVSGPDLVARLARSLGATFEYLHAPWLVESAELAASLVQQPDVAEVLARAAAADVACVGVGASGHGSSAILFNETYLKPDELAELKKQQAVGDVAGRSFDARGCPCPLSFDRRIIGLSLDSLKQIPVVIAVAVGERKGLALRAAVRGGLVNVVVTDQPGALAMLRD